MQDDLSRALGHASRLQQDILAWLKSQGLKVSKPWTVRAGQALPDTPAFLAVFLPEELANSGIANQFRVFETQGIVLFRFLPDDRLANFLGRDPEETRLYETWATEELKRRIESN